LARREDFESPLQAQVESPKVEVIWRLGGGGGGMSAPPPSDELGLPSDSDDSDEGSDSEDDVPDLVENFDEAQK
jgi:hypothetical protein